MPRRGHLYRYDDDEPTPVREMVRDIGRGLALGVLRTVVVGLVAAAPIIASEAWTILEHGLTTR